MRARTMMALTAMILGGCGGREAESPMAGMTAEEHARMMAGGTQGAVDSAGQVARRPVQLTPDQERALGIVYATVERELVTRTIRTVGQIQAPEPAIAEVTTKVEGFAERLLVDATGATVHRGDPLVELYSPVVVAAQEELLTARRLASAVDSSAPEAWHNARTMLEATRRRLASWDVPEEWVNEAERTGVVRRTVALRAPVSGVVLDKMVVRGQRVMPGMTLYRIADLSLVWVEGDVFEQDLRFVRLGAEAHIEVSAYPGEHLMARVGFIYPVVDPMSRTNRVRLVLPNPGLRLKPGMFATIFLDVSLGRALMVPMNAVIATGERNLVFVRDSSGTLLPREVVIGARSGDRLEILEGLEVGETIVRSATFLVDAESRLASTAATMPGLQHGSTLRAGPKPASDTARRSEHQHD